jgi:LacI family transcriptional regulator
MQDVAERAGVSRQTVSVVVNGKPGITVETSERVWAAVDELGYRVDAVARSLRTGRTHTIALIVSDTSAPFIGKLAVAAEDFGHASGYSLVIYNTHDDPEREAAYFAAATEGRVDGVLFISATDQNPGVGILGDAGVPAVAIDRVPVPYDGPSVTLDNIKVGCLAAEHLLCLGHTRLLHISGPRSMCMSRDRLRGFQQTLEHQGTGSDLQVELANGWHYQDGYDAMRGVLASGLRPTALFAAADALAIGAMHAIREAGLQVPNDLSVIGVDDIDVAAYQNPPLTTIRQSITELAELGLKLLLDILDGEELAQEHVVMEPVLVERRSTAPPPD